MILYIRILSNGDTEAKLIPNFYRKIHLKGIHICDSDDNIAFGVVDEHKPSDAHLKGSEDLIRENDKLRKENEFCCLEISVKCHQIHSRSAAATSIN